MTTNDNDLNATTSVVAINRPHDPNEAAAANLVRQAPALARARKALFDAYVAEGFSSDQALQLCTK